MGNCILASDDVRKYLDDMDAELSGISEDLSLIESTLGGTADGLERAIQSETAAYYADSIRTAIRSIESVRKRLDV